MLSVLGRGLALLQRYPLPLLLPTVVTVAAGAGMHQAIINLSLLRFGHLLIAIVGLFICFFFGCLAFLSIANYTVRSESNSEPPQIPEALDSLKYPGCARLLSGLLTRFALAVVIGGALTMLALVVGFMALKVSTHHPVPRSLSRPAYLWVTMAASVVILSRWVLAIPLFVQSNGQLKRVFATATRAIQGCRSFVVIFTLFVQAVSYALVRLTSPLHPHLSRGAGRYAPQLLEIIAAHGFQCAMWTYWMIVMTMLAMRLEGHDEPADVGSAIAA